MGNHGMDLVERGSGHGHQMVMDGQIIGSPDVEAVALQQLVDVPDTASGGILQRQDCDIRFALGYQQTGLRKSLHGTDGLARIEDRTGLAGIGGG